MKATLFTLVALLALCVVSVEAKVKGNGKIITKEVKISDYKSLHISGSIAGNNNFFEIKNNRVSPVFNYSQQSGKPSMKITIDENLFSLLSITTSNNKLYISVKENKQIEPTRFEINSHSSHLEELRMSGSIDFRLQSPLNGEMLNIEASGATDIYMEQQVRLDNCKLGASGASDMKFSDLNCRTIEVNSSGASDINLKGKADSGEFNASGSSDIKGYDFILEVLTCNASGSSDIQTYVTNQLEAKASGSSDIKYKGDPKTNSQISAAADLKQIR